MYYNIIRFPFSSINDEQYVLALCLCDKDDFTAVNAILGADRELFTQKATETVGGETVFNWEGTLTGSVKAEDDDRKDMWEPLVRSKLSFNMAVSDFPAWLMDYCNNNRAKAVLYKEGDKNDEMWRGYLVAQTLNMTVVNNLLSCPLVAVDEVSMAKYMNFKATLEYVTTDHWCSVFGLMEHFHTLHHTQGLSAAATGFGPLYTILDLGHSNRMLWHRGLCLVDSEGDPINDMPSALNVNLDRWLQDKEATWEQVLTEMLEYLGVTFSVGSYGLMTTCDAYLLACPTDLPTVQQFVYTFDNHTIVSHSYDVYATLTHPVRVGANLQVSSEPDRYKEVVVKSESERWKGHDYLTDEHYKEIDESKQVRYEWGNREDDSSFFKSLKWHKLKYIEPDTDEADFVEIAPCANGEGYIMARNGFLPYNDLSSCDNKEHPDRSCADSLDFITFKEGCCCVKIGEGETGGIDEDKLLKPYFLIMNHMWNNMLYYNVVGGYQMQSQHLADTPWLTLWPLGHDKPIHPSDMHYLSIRFDMMFIRENFPGVIGDEVLSLKAPDTSTPFVDLDWSHPAMIMPCYTSYFDFSQPGDYNASLLEWYDLYFEAYVRIGDYYYDGDVWTYVASGNTPPKCTVTLWNDTNEEYRILGNGKKTVHVKSYYYSISNPYRGTNIVDRYTNQTRLLATLGYESPHGQPLDGRLEIQIIGQIRFQSQPLEYNSIPFILLSGIEVNYTDDAELTEKDLSTETKFVMDADSHTKETMEMSLKMASPKVDGFFNNALIYDDGKAWINLRQVKYQSNLPLLFQLEWELARRLSVQYNGGQLFVELETPVSYDTNVHNVCFRVQSLTEATGNFLPVKRTFDYTRETLRAKMMRVNTSQSD